MMIHRTPTLFRYKAWSTAACHGPAGGAGSNLTVKVMIGLGVAVLLYLGFGVYFNKSKGETGVDLIPNYERWSDCCRLVKGGCSFTLVQCLGTKVRWATFSQYEDL